MPTILPSMGLTLPTRGPAGEGLWGDTEDANLSKIDSHNHTLGNGDPITPAGMNINADLPFSSLYAPTQLHRVQFSAIASGALTGANNKSLFVSDGTGGTTANELYWRNSSGNNVKLTTGNTLNVSAFAGTIGGDYSSVGAQLNYDTGGQKRYTFKEGTADSNGWARLQGGPVRIGKLGDTISNYIEHAVDAAIASPYTVTWPAALPASNARLVSVASTGAISFVPASLPSSVKPVAIDGSGTITAGYSRQQTYHVASAQPGTTAGSNSTITQSSQGVFLQFGSVTTTDDYLPLDLPVGATITSWTVWVNKVTTSGTVSFTLRATDMTTETGSTIGVAQTNSANNPGFITLGQSGLSTVTTAGTNYHIRARSGGTTGGADRVYGWSVTFS